MRVQQVQCQKGRQDAQKHIPPQDLPLRRPPPQPQHQRHGAGEQPQHRQRPNQSRFGQYLKIAVVDANGMGVEKSPPRFRLESPVAVAPDRIRGKQLQRQLPVPDSAPVRSYYPPHTGSVVSAGRLNGGRLVGSGLPLLAAQGWNNIIALLPLCPPLRDLPGAGIPVPQHNPVVGNVVARRVGLIPSQYQATFAAFGAGVASAAAVAIALRHSGYRLRPIPGSCLAFGPHAHQVLLPGDQPANSVANHQGAVAGRQAFISRRQPGYGNAGFSLKYTVHTLQGRFPGRQNRHQKQPGDDNCGN